jgi:hypothetical protein
MVYENTHNFHVIFLINKRLWVKYVRQGIVFVHNPIYIQMSSLHNLHKSFCTHKNCNHHAYLTNPWHADSSATEVSASPDPRT